MEKLLDDGTLGLDWIVYSGSIWPVGDERLKKQIIKGLDDIRPFRCGVGYYIVMKGYDSFCLYSD